MRYLAYISYDGSNYYGFSSQKNKLNIQDTITKALSILTKLEIKITPAGRTDAHVHAINQAISFDLSFKINESAFLKGINKILPLDIRFNEIIKVSDDFHPRFCAKTKEYHYTISTTPPSVFLSRYQSYYPNLDINLIKEATKLLVGTHDFYAFTPTPLPNKPTIKTIYSIEVEAKDNIIKLIFIGNGFLKYQIRSMVGSIIDISLQKKPLSVITTMLETKSRLLCSKSASANGLCLFRVNY